MNDNCNSVALNFEIIYWLLISEKNRIFKMAAVGKSKISTISLVYEYKMRNSFFYLRFWAILWMRNPLRINNPNVYSFFFFFQCQSIWPFPQFVDHTDLNARDGNISNTLNGSGLKMTVKPLTISEMCTSAEWIVYKSQSQMRFAMKGKPESLLVFFSHIHTLCIQCIFNLPQIMWKS